MWRRLTIAEPVPAGESVPDVPGADTATGRWRGIGTTVRGSRHVQTGAPCQDALAWSPGSACGDVLVLAVADGHGSERHFRSDTGAALAVQVGTELLAAFLHAHQQEADPTRLEQAAADLPRMIEAEWKAAVDQDILADPGNAGDDADPYTAFGTTLLLVGCTPCCFLALQLGDGDILAVARDGAVRRPLPVDPLLSGNQTTSLCLPDAASYMRIASGPVDEADPDLFMAATDGYANSFRDDAGFLQAAREYAGLVAAHDPNWVAAQLGDWLTETSTNGSGDDISVGLLFAPPHADPQAQPDDPHAPD